MIVIMLSDCPPKVRGDLSKWLCEINTGVFVGNVSSRVREEVWQRICENIKSGQATMVFSAPGEQKMDFRVHNTTWEPVDLDGIKLMRRPLPSARASKMSEKEDKGISGAKSRAERLYMADKMAKARARKKFQEDFVVLDIETTGTSPEKDEIIEVGALKIEADTVTEEFSMLIQIKGEIPIEIQKLTGITEQELIRRKAAAPAGAVVAAAEINTETKKENKTMTKTMKIEGMMCGHCEAAVKKALEALDGVASAEVSHEKGTAVVTLDKDVDNAVLTKAVEDKDYKVVSVQ